MRARTCTRTSGFHPRRWWNRRGRVRVRFQLTPCRLIARYRRVRLRRLAELPAPTTAPSPLQRSASSTIKLSSTTDRFTDGFIATSRPFLFSRQVSALSVPTRERRPGEVSVTRWRNRLCAATQLWMIRACAPRVHAAPGVSSPGGPTIRRRERASRYYANPVKLRTGQTVPDLTPSRCHCIKIITTRGLDVRRPGASQPHCLGLNGPDICIRDPEDHYFKEKSNEIIIEKINYYLIIASVDR